MILSHHSQYYFWFIFSLIINFNLHSQKLWVDMESGYNTISDLQYINDSTYAVSTLSYGNISAEGNVQIIQNDVVILKKLIVDPEDLRLRMKEDVLMVDAIFQDECDITFNAFFSMPYDSMPERYSLNYDDVLDDFFPEMLIADDGQIYLLSNGNFTEERHLITIGESKNDTLISLNIYGGVDLTKKDDFLIIYGAFDFIIFNIKTRESVTINTRDDIQDIAFVEEELYVLSGDTIRIYNLMGNHLESRSLLQNFVFKDIEEGDSGIYLTGYTPDYLEWKVYQLTDDSLIEYYHIPSDTLRFYRTEWMPNFGLVGIGSFVTQDFELNYTSPGIQILNGCLVFMDQEESVDSIDFGVSFESYEIELIENEIDFLWNEYRLTTSILVSNHGEQRLENFKAYTTFVTQLVGYCYYDYLIYESDEIQPFEEVIIHDTTYWSTYPGYISDICLWGYSAGNRYDYFHDDNIDCITISSTENVDSIDSMFIYPNPTAEEIHISGIPLNTSFEIVNISGYLIQEGNLNGSKEITVGNLKSGIYFLRIGHQSFKFVKI